jgi:hypothetical protein
VSAPWTDPFEKFCSSYTVDADGCHIWHESTDKDGYGRFYANADRYGTPNTDKAHRWIFEVVHGFSPPVVMHHCDKPACVRISCLMPGTIAENNADMTRKGRGGHGVVGGIRGQDHHKAKLTDNQVREIREEYPQGILSYGMLADVYGVKESSVKSIINGHRRRKISR